MFTAVTGRQSMEPEEIHLVINQMFNVLKNIKDFSVRDVSLKNGRESIDYAKSRGAKSRSLCLKNNKEGSLASETAGGLENVQKI
jgi:hypothetical protein